MKHGRQGARQTLARGRNRSYYSREHWSPVLSPMRPCQRVLWAQYQYKRCRPPTRCYVSALTPPPSPSPPQRRRQQQLVAAACVTMVDVDPALDEALWAPRAEAVRWTAARLRDGLAALPAAAPPRSAQAGGGGVARGAGSQQRHQRALGVLLAADETVAALNARYRGRDRPTDVLSFSTAGVEPWLERRDLGDVVLGVRGSLAAWAQALA
jgi:hypothetical protein